MRPPVPPPLPPHVRQGSVAATVRALPRGVRPSETWQRAAFAILRLNAKECEALGQVFEDEDLAAERRVLVLDLLAGAGSFEAQTVMRRLLALAVARRESRMFATFVQRLGFVEHPDGPTLRFLMSVIAESRGEPPDVRAACAYALGAAAGHAWHAGDHDAAIRSVDMLRRDLRTARAPHDKASLLTALGNAGLPLDEPLVLRFVQDRDALVRAAAALALRKMRTATAKAALLELVTDSEQKVAHGALVALGEQHLDEEDLERLADLVLGGRTALALDGRILGLIVSQGRELQPAPPGPTAIENALRLLLGRVEAAASTTGSGEHRVGSGQHRVVITSDEAPTIAAATPSKVAGSGAYRIVRPTDTVDDVRARLAALGLDPHARTSMIPPPPAPRAVSAEATIRRR